MVLAYDSEGLPPGGTSLFSQAFCHQWAWSTIKKSPPGKKRSLPDRRILPGSVSMTIQTGTRYPLLFTYRDTLFGTGFLVEVETKGRALGVDEPGDGVWIYGVNPGAIAASGDNLIEAHAAFRSAYRQVLVDTAASVNSYDEFKAAVEVFFNATDVDADAWSAAVDEVRAGHVTAPLPREDAASPRGVSVSIKQWENVQPEDNETRVDLEALAA